MTGPGGAGPLSWRGFPAARARPLPAATEHPVCPYCRTEDPDWWEGAPEFAGPGSRWEDGCRSCRRRYLVCMISDTRFETRPLTPDTAKP